MLRRIAGGAIAAAVAVGGMVGASATAGAGTRPAAAPARIYVRPCPGESFSVKPASFVLACADANAYFLHLHWTDWGGTIAKATGTYYANNCNPDCVDGKIVHTAGTMTLSRKRHKDGREVYTFLRAKANTPGEYFPPYTGTLGY